MTKEVILRSYLVDDFFIERGYLKPGDAETYKWGSNPNNKLIRVIELAIEGNVSYDSPNVTEKKINQLLNQS